MEAIRLLTYNINYVLATEGGLFKSEKIILDCLLSCEADIIVIQEVHEGWRCIFDQHINLYPYRKFVDDNGKFACGHFIFSKYPIKFCFEVRTDGILKDGRFPQWVGCFELFGKDVWIASVHLKPPLIDGRASLLSMRKTTKTRKEELEYLLSQISYFRNDEDPLILAGDFNESEDYTALKYLFKKWKMNDSLSHVPKQHTHWWPIRKHGDKHLVLRSRLDHVMYLPQSVSTESVEVLKGFEGNSSDHLPVLATLSFQSENKRKKRPSYTYFKISRKKMESGTIWSFE